MIRSLQTLAAISSPEHVVVNTKKNMIKERMYCSKKIFHALKCSVCIARHTVATTLYAAISNSAAKQWTSERLKTLQTDPWQTIEKRWTEQKMQFLLIMECARVTIVEQHTSSQKRTLMLLTQEYSWGRWYLYSSIADLACINTRNFSKLCSPVDFSKLLFNL